MKDRGVRRYQEKRIKAKVKKVETARKDLCRNACDPSEEPTKKTIGRLASVHGADCSCSKCGNPRRYAKGKDKLTMQEKKAKDVQ